jgi:hypothetical protein
MKVIYFWILMLTWLGSATIGCLAGRLVADPMAAVPVAVFGSGTLLHVILIVARYCFGAEFDRS